MSKNPTYEELEQKVKELESNINELKHIELALRKSESRFKAIFNQSFQFSILLDIYGNVLEVNDLCYEVCGQFAEGVVGNPLWDAGWWKQFPEIRKRTQSAVQKTLQGNIITDEAIFIDRDRHVRHGIRIFSPIKDETDKIQLISVVGLDVSERKHAEKALRDSEEKFRQLAENIREVFWIGSSDWNEVYYISPAYEDVWGLSCKSLYDQSRSWMDAIVEEDRERVIAVIPEKLEGSSEIIFPEYRIIQPDGTVRWILARAYPILNERGEIYRIAGIAEDITERKQLEEELRQSHKMEAVGTLAGGIAHDFNNMLNIILGNTEIAMDDVPEWNPARFNLGEIKTASLRAKDVVRQLLSFAHKTDQKRKPVKISPIVSGALRLLRSSIPTTIEFRSNIQRDSAIVVADPTQINQIIINLCTNAAHAMEEDGGVLEISLDSLTLDESTAQSYELSPGRYVKLSVRDTGHGIASEIKDRIFDPYFTTREVGKGTGMGLAVAHGIVVSHDGIITVDSEVGKGTTFNVFLPIVKRELVPEISIDEYLPTGKERILFVDDDESIVKMGAQRLERLGYQVETTTNPLEALDLFRSKPDDFDLVITDLTMPKMTGDKLINEILNVRSDTPIIICTGFSKKIDENKAREIGAAGHLEKPHEKSELAVIVRQVLDGQ